MVIHLKIDLLSWLLFPQAGADQRWNQGGGANHKSRPGVIWASGCVHLIVLGGGHLYQVLQEVDRFTRFSEQAVVRGPRLVLSPCQVSARVRSSNSLCSPSDIGPSSRPRSTTTSATLSVSPSSLSNLWITTRGYLQIPGGQNLTLLVLELTFLLCKTKNGNFL